MESQWTDSMEHVFSHFIDKKTEAGGVCYNLFKITTQLLDINQNHSDWSVFLAFSTWIMEIINSIYSIWLRIEWVNLH